MRLLSLFIGCLLGALVTTPVLANPRGATVVHGQVSGLPTAGVNLPNLRITNSAGAIINWNSFNIGANEVTRFIQPNAASAVLNRVTGADLSALMGQLSSNGRVFLINPNGIVVGQNAVINTAGFIASTLDMTDEDFIAGKLRFEGDGNSGSIENHGFIKVSDGGDILLVAPSITNAGSLTSEGGNLLLAAGEAVTITSLDDVKVQFELQAPEHQALNLGEMIAQGGAAAMFAGTIRNSGSISANGLSVDAGGRIQLVASHATEISDSGRLAANGSDGGEIHIETLAGDTTVAGDVEARGLAGVGGTVRVLGQRVGLFGEATVDVSGENGGGVALIGGDFQGNNGAIQNAEQTAVSGGATIKADAITSGDGGRVIVWADDYTQGYGAISARGGESSGDGGFVEVSGKKTLDFQARVDTAAPAGKTGQLLLDPTNITVANTGQTFAALDNAPANNILAFNESPGGNVNLLASSLTSLAASITLQADEDINFNVPVNMIIFGVGLAAQAERISVNSTITTNGGVVDFSSFANGQSADDTGILIGNLGSIDTTSGGANPGGADVNLTGTDAPLGGDVVSVNGSINAGTSDITITAPDWDVGGTGTMTAANLTVVADGDVNFTGANQVQAIDLETEVSGLANDIIYNTALDVAISRIQQNASGGDVTITGIGACTGGAGCDFNLAGNIAFNGARTLTLNTGGPGLVTFTGGNIGLGTGLISIPGSVEINAAGGNAINFNNTVTIGGDLDVLSGTLGGGGTVNVAGTTTWGATGSFGAGGDVNANGGLVVTGTGTRSSQRDIFITSPGTNTWTGSGAIAGGGSIQLQSNAIDIQGTLDLNLQFVNAGLVTKSGATTASFGNLTNTGVFNIGGTGGIEITGNSDNSGTITLTSSNATFEISGGNFSQTGAGTLGGVANSTVLLSGGEFNHSGAATAPLYTLQFDSGTLSGTATLNLTNSTLNWTSGTIRVANFQATNSTINFLGAGAKVFENTLFSSDNTSNVNWNGGDLSATSSAVVSFNRFFTILTTNSADTVSSTTGGLFNFNGGLSKNLAGTISLLADFTSQFNWNLNAGRLVVNSPNQGTFNSGTTAFVAAGAELELNGTGATRYDFNSGSSITGAGDVFILSPGSSQFNAGSIYSITGATDVSGATVDIAAGNNFTTGDLIIGNNTDMTGAGDVTVNGNLSGTIGSLGAVSGGFSTTGSVLVNGGNTNLTVNQNGTLFRDNGLLFNGSGTFVISGTHFTSAFSLSGGGAITNAGGMFLIDNDIDIGGATAGNFINTGTIQKINSPGGSNSVNMPLFNDGLVQVQSGSLGFIRGGTHNGTFETNDAAGDLTLGGSNHMLNGGSSIIGPGGIVFSTGANHVVDGTISLFGTGALTIDAPNLNSTTVTINGSLTVHDIFTMEGSGSTATLVVNGAANILDTVNATQGDITLNNIVAISGAANIGGFSTLSLGNPANSIAIGDLNFVGPGTLSGDIDITVGSLFNVAHGGTAVDSIINLSPGRALTLTNGGTINVTASSGQFELQGGEIINNGVLNWLGRPIAMTAGTTITNNGTFDIQTDSVISGTGNFGNTSTGVLTKSASIGATTFQGGISLTQDGIINADSGSLDIVQSFNNNGTINLGGGSLVAFGASFINQPGRLITGFGTLDVSASAFTNNGIIAPGTAAPGTMNIIGDVVFGVTGVLEARLASGLTNDQLVVNGNVSITPGATLEIIAFGGYGGNVGDVFIGTIQPSGSLTGQFTNVIQDPAFATRSLYSAGPPGQLDIEVIGFGTVNQWILPGNGNWELASNWSLGITPIASHLALIDSGVMVTHGVGTDTIDTLFLDSLSVLDLTGGRLNINGDSTIDGTVAIDGGAALGGSGDLTFVSPLIVKSGTMDGTGMTIATAGIVIDAGNGFTGAVFDRDVEHSGNQIWNMGAFSILGSGDFNHQSGLLTLQPNNPGAAVSFLPDFINDGDVDIGGIASSVNFTRFDNQGTVNVNAGIFALNSGSNSGSGTINLAAASEILFGGDFLFSDGNLSGAGLVRVFGGTTEVGGGTFAPLGGLEIDSGTLVFDSSQLLSPDINVGFGGELIVTGGAIVDTAGNINTAGMVTVDSLGTLQAAGSYLQNAGTSTIHGTLILGLDALLLGGTLLGNGVIDVGVGAGTVNNDAATVSAGASPGLLSIIGNYAQSANALLALELGGPTPGADFDFISITGNAALDGELVVDTLPGFEPAEGDSFQFMSFASVNGGFANVTSTSVQEFVGVVSANGYSVVAQAVPLPPGEEPGPDLGLPSIMQGDVLPELLQPQEALVLNDFSNDVNEKISEGEPEPASDDEADDSTYAELDDNAEGNEGGDSGGDEDVGVLPELCSA